MMQARIGEIEIHQNKDVKIEVKIDVHLGRSWHHRAITLYADNLHEGARMGLAICNAIDKLEDVVSRRM